LILIIKNIKKIKKSKELKNIFFDNLDIDHFNKKSKKKLLEKNFRNWKIGFLPKIGFFGFFFNFSIFFQMV
jgi:hypothetical protein